MLDFLKKDLYEDEKPIFEKFKKKRLETNEEYLRRMEEDMNTDDDEDDSLGFDKFDDFGSDLDSEFLGGDSFDLSGDSGGFDWGGGFDSYGSSGVVDSKGINEIEHDKSWENESKGILVFVKSLPNMLMKAVKHFIFDFPKKEEWLKILPMLTKVNLIVIGIGIFFMIVKVPIPLVSPVWQIGFNGVSLILAQSVLRFVYKTGYMDYKDGKFEFAVDNGGDSDEEGQQESEGSIDEMVSTDMFSDGLFNATEDSDNEVSFFDNISSEDGLEDGSEDMFGNFDEDMDADKGMDNTASIIEGLNIEDEGEEFEIEDEDEYNEEEEDRADVLPESPVAYSKSNAEMYYETLLNVYKSNEKYANVEIKNRTDLLRSFSGYFITGDKEFGKYKKLKPRGTEYSNVAYAIFRGIVQIYPQFNTIPKAKDGEKPNPSDYLFTITSIKRSPLLYIVETRLPKYINTKTLEAKRVFLEDSLKVSANDTDVSILIEAYAGKIIFKLLRFGGKGVTIGDVLRIEDAKCASGKTAFEEFADEKKGIPLLVGLVNNETPLVIDYEENTSGIIVGGSGSGKSWTTFSWMFEFVTANSPKEFQFIVLDKKDSTFWKQFALCPHVIGLHKDEYSFVEILQEVEKERQRRQDLLGKLGQEDVRGYREELNERIKNGDVSAYDELEKMPLLTVIIDEITATMKSLEDDKEMYEAFKSILTQITAQGRSAGIRLLLIGQKATNESIYKPVMTNASLKFAMRIDNEAEFKTMLGKEIEKDPKPTARGMGILSSMDVSGKKPMIKTLILGAKTNTDMIMLLRVMALDWYRRMHGKMDLMELQGDMSFTDLTFNRPQRIASIEEDIYKGNILNKPGYELKDVQMVGTVEKIPQADISVDELEEEISESEIGASFDLNKDFSESKIVDDKFENNVLSEKEKEMQDKEAELIKREKELEKKLAELSKLKESSGDEQKDTFVADENLDTSYIIDSSDSLKDSVELNKKPKKKIVKRVRKSVKATEGIEEKPQIKKKHIKKVSVNSERKLDSGNRNKDLEDTTKSISKPSKEDNYFEETAKESAESSKGIVKIDETLNKKAKIANKSSRTDEIVKEQIKDKQKTDRLNSNNSKMIKKIPIERYIIENGYKEDSFTFSMSIGEVASMYTVRQIERALNLALIFEDNGKYYTTI